MFKGWKNISKMSRELKMTQSNLQQNINDMRRIRKMFFAELEKSMTSHGTTKYLIAKATLNKGS